MGHADHDLLARRARPPFDDRSSSGISVSAPSREKRFCPGIACRNFSNTSASVRWSGSALLLGVGLLPAVPSIRRSQPRIRVLDVHVLDADRAAVGLAQVVDDLAQRGLSPGDVEVELAVEVGLGETVGAVVELGC